MTDPLTSDDRAALARHLRRTLKEAKFPMSDANRERRAVLEKLEPPSEPNPPPPLPTGRVNRVKPDSAVASVRRVYTAAIRSVLKLNALFSYSLRQSRVNYSTVLSGTAVLWR